MTNYVVAPGVLCEEVDGRALLIDSGSSELITLNDMGSLVWSILAIDGTTLPDVIAAVATSYPPALHNQIASDVESFLDELIDLGLVEART
jgi:hypothetical protein